MPVSGSITTSAPVARRGSPGSRPNVLCSVPKVRTDISARTVKPRLSSRSKAVVDSISAFTWFGCEVVKRGKSIVSVFSGEPGARHANKQHHTKQNINENTKDTQRRAEPPPPHINNIILIVFFSGGSGTH